MSATRFAADYAKRVSNCKKCKQKVEKGSLRLAKVGANPFASESDDAEMKQYFHTDCLFEGFTRVRAGTKVIESAADLEGWSDLKQSDKDDILGKIQEFEDNKNKKAAGGSLNQKAAKTETKQAKLTDFVQSPTKAAPKKTTKTAADDDDGTPAPEEAKTQSDDDLLSTFSGLCRRLSDTPEYTRKTAIVEKLIDKGVGGSGYNGDLYLLCKLLLPGTDHRVYNLKEKSIVKHCSEIFDVDPDEMLDHFNKEGDVSITVSEYYTRGKQNHVAKSVLTLQDVDKWLDELTKYTTEDDQLRHLRKIIRRSTAEDLQTIIRMIKKDLRINAGAKHILEAVAPNAFEAFQAARDLRAVIDKALRYRAAHHDTTGADVHPSKRLSISVKVGVAVKPMLAEPCKSVDFAMKRCPNGMYAEIKYDGERVQVHKKGHKFSFFSRSLKPVQNHKVSELAAFIPQAFPKGGDLILDSEVLLIDTRDGKPLPFGTLGVHKKEKHQYANVCLFVFDCLLYDGESLLDRPIEYRKKILDENMVEVPNRIMRSDVEIIKHGENKVLMGMIQRAIDEGLEGLVMKDLHGDYEPGKRHWLKVKKDYLEEGKMADTADLIVLGAYYGTGSKGGMMSVFLMGTYCTKSKRFLTVTKCGNGHDDATLDKINKHLANKVTKINRDYDSLPAWLSCDRGLVPDFVVKDPKTAPVWEITGAEFSKSDRHTAGGISIRFPRVTRIRDDKDWQTATNVDELKALYETSKQKADVTGGDEDDDAYDRVHLFGRTENLDASGGDTSPTKESPKKESPKKESPKKESPKNESPKKESPKKELPKTQPESSVVDSVESPVKARRKRSADDNEPPSSPVKKKLRQREPCKYGAGCYQTNPKHKQQFSHPNEDTKMASDLPDAPPKSTADEEFLSDLVFYIAKDVKNREKLERYVQYFGGEMEETYDGDIVSHAILETSDPNISDGIKADWLWSCIKAKELKKITSNDQS